jgi:hypothetical protein
MIFMIVTHVETGRYGIQRVHRRRETGRAARLEVAGDVCQLSRHTTWDRMRDRKSKYSPLTQVHRGANDKHGH